MEPVDASEEAVSGACCRYADGAHLHEDCEMIRHIVDLMRSGIHVAIVTAAGVVAWYHMSICWLSTALIDLGGARPGLQTACVSGIRLERRVQILV